LVNVSLHGSTYGLNGGKALFGGKQERRKEIAQISMMHPRTFVAQTTCAHVNHFYRSLIYALEIDGQAIVCVYTTSQPEHGVADNMATDQDRLAVDTRAFPLLIYDPRKGDTIKERLSLQGNPAVNEDWWLNPKTGQQVDFIDFARSEGRFGKHFDKDGNPSPTLLYAKQDRLENWHVLQDLAGVRGGKPAAKPAAAAAAQAAAKDGTGAAAKASAPARTNDNGKSAGGFSVGTKIKYNDGSAWVGGTVASVEPAVLKLDDNTVIQTSMDVLLAGAAEGLIVAQ
jgi:hypothetical protein